MVANLYEVFGLLLDNHYGMNWVTKPQTCASVQLHELDVLIDGCFKHKRYSRVAVTGVPFSNFTCVTFSQILQETDFRLNVIREDALLSKRGTEDIGYDRRLD